MLWLILFPVLSKTRDTSAAVALATRRAEAQRACNPAEAVAVLALDSSEQFQVAQDSLDAGLPLSMLREDRTHPILRSPELNRLLSRTRVNHLHKCDGTQDIFSSFNSLSFERLSVGYNIYSLPFTTSRNKIIIRALVIGRKEIDNGRKLSATQFLELLESKLELSFKGGLHAGTERSQNGRNS